MKKVFLVSLILFLSLTAQSCSFGSEPEPVAEPELVVDEKPLNYYVITNEAQALQGAKDRYNLAFAKAKEWQSEVDLMLVSATFKNSLENSGVYDRFLFSSDLDPDLYFSIDISREDAGVYTRSLVYRDDYRIKSGVNPIPVKYWKMSVEKTLEYADSQGGAQFREDNSGYQVEMMLSLVNGKNLAWYVVYSAPGVKSFEKIIDANSGEEIPISPTTTTATDESDLTSSGGRE